MLIVYYVYKSITTSIKMKVNNMEILFTTEEVMLALRVKMPTICSWIHQQRLSVFRSGRSVMIRESVLIKVIEEGLDDVTQRKDIT